MWETRYDASGFTPCEEDKTFLSVKNKENHNQKILKNETDETKKFKIRNQFKTEFLEYPKDGPEPGKVLIYNMYFENNDKPRHGSKNDTQAVINCLQNQGFNIYEEDIYNDFTKEQFEKSIDDVCNSNLSAVNCLIMFFFSHGEENGKLETLNGSVDTSTIFDRFSKCTSLKNKPKVFIFQSCKGSGASTIDGNDDVKIMSDDIFAKGMPPDMLVLYATMEGKVAVRDPDYSGSWLIKNFCKNVTAFGAREDLVSIALRTTKCVCANYKIVDFKKEIICLKQVPVMVSTLRRKFFLNTNKHRHVLIKVIDELKNLKGHVKSLEEKINALPSKK